MNKKLTFLGAGNMAGAIIKSLDGYDICIYDKNKAVYDNFKNVKFSDSAEEAVNYGDYIILGVKPQNMEEILTEIKNKDKIFISIAAGITIERIESLLEVHVPVVRTMPNMPMMIGKGVIAVSRNDLVPDADFEFICEMFKRTAEVLTVPEEHINAITSVTSSAPAYVYLFIKAIYDSALSQGLHYDNMLEIICHMVAGSAEMLLSTGKLPGELINMVASKGGTTEAALKVFNENNFAEIIGKAMINCTERAEEIGNGKEKI
ncbi:MAG: pyrroline-5-carboxylate reductase [Oscillospiraceae bacterium]|nr:pyrroline-5-carboxylate reductase [Oscillospiraceae bacterium]